VVYPKPKKAHWRKPNGQIVCGKNAVLVTDDWDGVTCDTCCRRFPRQKQDAINRLVSIARCTVNEDVEKFLSEKDVFKLHTILREKSRHELTVISYLIAVIEEGALSNEDIIKELRELIRTRIIRSVMES